LIFTENNDLPTVDLLLTEKVAKFQYDRGLGLPVKTLNAAILVA